MSHPYRTGWRPSPPVTLRWPWVALLVALSYLTVAIVAVEGCGPKPWPVTAQAVIASHAHALRAADVLLARAIANDPLTGAAAEAKYGPAVSALRIARAALLEAEHAADVGRAVDSAASRCAAYRALAGALDHVRPLTATLAAAGVQSPPEVAASATALGEAAGGLADACESGGAR
jgi:hypothetical protein